MVSFFIVYYCSGINCSLSASLSPKWTLVILGLLLICLKLLRCTFSFQDLNTLLIDVTISINGVFITCPIRQSDYVISFDQQIFHIEKGYYVVRLSCQINSSTLRVHI